MAGHLGHVNATTMNQMIVKIDAERSLLYIKGAVPGPISSVVRVRDALKKTDA
jgi:large subunit ribosomal protein L3